MRSLFVVFLCSTRMSYGFTAPSVRSSEDRFILLSSAKLIPDDVTSRTNFLHALGLSLISVPSNSLAFDGGVGGLGKTKPETGVEFYDKDFMPSQNAKGVVSAEIRSLAGQPILASFQSPWPLLSTATGLETRDIRTTESAFVQVLEKVDNWQSPKVFRQLLLGSVLASQGKYGAYSAPTDVKVVASKEKADVFTVTFTSYTPAMLESERQLSVAAKAVDNTLVLLCVGTTRARFSSQKKVIDKIIDSFEAAAAPSSKLRSR
jgi:hypothetical protein